MTPPSEIYPNSVHFPPTPLLPPNPKHGALLFSSGPESLLYSCLNKMILFPCKLGPITPELKTLQWFPVSLKIKSKFFILANKAPSTSLTSSPSSLTVLHWPPPVLPIWQGFCTHYCLCPKQRLLPRCSHACLLLRGTPQRPSLTNLSQVTYPLPSPTSLVSFLS